MPSLEDERFAQLAGEKGYLSSDQLQAGLEVQEKGLAAGEVKDLADILLGQGVLEVTHVVQLNEAVRQAGPLRLGDFEIIKKLGEGGMGAVYHARQISMDREVALKLLPAHLAKDRTLTTRFVQEARACAKLDHPNIIRGLAVGEEKGQHYFAMEFVDGASLDEIIDQSGPMDINQAVEIIRQVLDALAHAHELSMVHRDIKPANIMIAKDGKAKLADLGLVKRTDADVTRLTMSNVGMGTPDYMPPEQARSAKDVDAKSDIYALGATFYHMLTGKLPYQGETVYEVMQKHEEGRLKSPRSLRPELPSELSLAVEKMMARKPENRFQSAEEALQALDRFAGVAAAAAAQKPKTVAPRLSDKYWHIQFKAADGKQRKHKVLTKDLRLLLQEGKVPRTAEAKKGSLGDFRPISEFTELSQSSKWASAAQSAKARSSAKKKTQQRGGSALRAMYQDIEAKTLRARKMKKIKCILKRVVPLVILVVVIIVGYAYRDAILELVNKVRNR